MKSISIGDVKVPLVDYAVGAASVLGIRDSGKTVTSKGIAEQLLDSNIPIIVLDAVGKWRWMKVAADQENGKAYKVVVAGGREPDLPLTPHSVPEIVRAALKERIPLVIDLFSKELSKGDWRRIVQTAIKIIHYENEGGALHVFLEEAAEFVPQRIMDKDVALVYGEVEKLVRMGGNASVGITLINQRSQEVNKAVLEQCTSLILGCQVGNKAIEAVGKWVDRLDKGIAAEVTESLPKLSAGEAWVWTRQSPDKPSLEKMPMCRSFHPDRRTPEIVLETVKRTDTAAFVAKLAESIPKVIEEAKANDPAELKRKLRETEQKLRQAEQKQPEVKQLPAVEAPVLTKDERGQIEKLISTFNELYLSAESGYLKVQEIGAATNALKPEIVQLRGLLETRMRSVSPTPIPRADRIYRTQIPAKLKPEDFSPVNNGDLGKGERRILVALNQYPEGCYRDQLTILTGYKRSSRDTYIQRLREKGYAESNGDVVLTTAAGKAALGTDFEPLPYGPDLQRYWLERLPQGERSVFEILVTAYPNDVQRDQISERTGYQRSSRDTYLQRLSSRRLVENVGRGAVRAAKQLFE